VPRTGGERQTPERDTSHPYIIEGKKCNKVNPILSDHMNKVRITAIRQTVYADLMAKYENPIEHTCDVVEGQQWVSVDGKRPEGMCPSAWYSMKEFVESLARGEGNFYDGWMQNPMSAMISCNDGFRPFSFYIEVID
jgi:uncharacterized repeat protein (TIGR04076 family)